MTSKRLFFRVMAEDMSHRIWTAALSVLGSILVLPVSWLMWRSSRTDHIEAIFRAMPGDGEKMAAEEILEAVYFFVEYMGIIGGVLTIAVALVAGMTGFRWLFHRNMVDTYHSLPVKRGMLYGACYLNGILIWLLPYSVFWLFTAAMGGSYIRDLGGGRGELAEMAGQAQISFLTAAVIYLMVYHLILLAVMLCGNALNALTAALIMGFGGFAFFGMIYVFIDTYMDFFLDRDIWMDLVVRTAPLVSAPELIYERVQAAEAFGELCGILLPNALLAVLLGVLARLLYRRRVSELAEQGVGSRKAALVMKLAVSAVAGMCGWEMFYALVNRHSIGWGFFGAVLASVLASGVLEVVFQMDFKAFFSHRIQMAFGAAAALLLCSAFYWDWLGYDAYLPAKDEVAEIAVCDPMCANRYIRSLAEEEILELVHIQDTDAAFAFLERMVENDGPESGRTDRDWDNVMTRVTLKSGRSYYRLYRAYKEDLDVLRPLLAGRAYMEQAYCISEQVMRNYKGAVVIRGGKGRELGAAAFTDIAEAYNRDVLDDPEGMLAGRGRLLMRINWEYRETDRGSRRYRDYCMNVYDTMERTLEALERAGFGEWTETADPSQIRSVLLGLETYSYDMTEAERIEAARKKYGIYVPEETEAQPAAPATVETAATTRDLAGPASLKITDPEELKELIPLLEYETPYRSNTLFQEAYIEVLMVDAQGEEIPCYIRKGVLPEKYILRFGGI